MTESKRAKELGLDSLEELIKVTDADRMYFHRMFNNKKRKKVFDLVCIGLVAQKFAKQISKQ